MLWLENIAILNWLRKWVKSKYRMLIYKDKNTH